MSIHTVHHNLPKIVSKGIIKSMIGSLNATAIAYARMHLRSAARNTDPDAVPSIDDLNDEMAAVSEALERQRAQRDMGFETQMPTGELIERLMALRSYFVDRLMQMKDASNDMPLTILETVSFQMQRTPDANDSLLEALAIAVDIDPAMLKAAQVKMIHDDAADLKANAGKLVDYLGQFCDVDTDFDDEAVNANFEALPKHVQYKLMSAAIRAHDKAQQRALQHLLRGKLDAAGDIKMLKANRDELILWLIDFGTANRHDLDAYVERGGMLPEVEDRTVVVANTKKAEPAPAPASKSASMRRAPAPTAA